MILIINKIFFNVKCEFTFAAYYVTRKLPVVS
jgi:hypothetical protein